MNNGKGYYSTRKRSDISTNLFVRDLKSKKVKKMTLEEEKIASRDELVYANAAFAVSVANGYYNATGDIPMVTKEDLITEAIYGLMDAASRYDPSKNCKFTTYAVWYVKAHINTFLRNNRAVKPGSYHLFKKKVEEGGRYVSCHSLSSLVVHEDGEEEFDDGPDFAMPTDQLPDNVMEREQERKYLNKLFAPLSKQEEHVARCRVGLISSNEAEKFKDIAVHMGVSTQRVHQIWVLALKKMQKFAIDNDYTFKNFLTEGELV